MMPNAIIDKLGNYDYHDLVVKSVEFYGESEVKLIVSTLPFDEKTNEYRESKLFSRELESNWRQKSIENLEKDFWGKAPKNGTPLVEKVHRLRTIQIEKLEPKDVRLLIGQRVGLKFLIPVALDILRHDLFIDTDFYNGDLLQNVMQVDNEFWNNNKDLKAQLDDLLKGCTDEDKENFKKDKFANKET